MNEDSAYKNYIHSSHDLLTTDEGRRAGFADLALEKNRKMVPLLGEARALKVYVSHINTPEELLRMKAIHGALLIAAGISDNVANHLTEKERLETIEIFIEKFLATEGKNFANELVDRYLLSRNNAIKKSIKYLTNSLAERKLTRAIISTLNVEKRSYSWLHSKTMQWIPMSDDDAEIEFQLRGLSWSYHKHPRTLIYNLTVPLVRKNVDLCLFACEPEAMIFGKNTLSVHYAPEKYLALGELKGGIDPAGADEHWKTANSALHRIRTGFARKSFTPHTFFIGAAIEKSMAEEIFHQLETDVLTNAANLTDHTQVLSLCKWLIQL